MTFRLAVRTTPILEKSPGEWRRTVVSKPWRGPWPGEKGARIFKGRETMRVGNCFKVTPHLCWGDSQSLAIPGVWWFSA